MTTKYLTRPFEIKEISDDGTFEGYGSVFHVEDSYKDVVLPGAFIKSLDNWRAKGLLPPVLWQHRSSEPLGPYLEMEEDSVGLYLKGRLLRDDVAKAREAHALMKAKAVTGLSIGYHPMAEDYDRKTGITTLKEVDLWEVSIVTFPANDLARITEVKNIETRRQFEKFLRDSGFSKSEAIRIASRGFERRESAAGNEYAELRSIINNTTRMLTR